jgi:hypothetical protein
MQPGSGRGLVGAFARMTAGQGLLEVVHVELGIVPPFPSRLARAADRIEFTLSTLSGGTCYGLAVHFQLLSTRGYRPDAVTFSYSPYSVGQIRDSHPVAERSQAQSGQVVTRPSWSTLLGSPLAS